MKGLSLYVLLILLSFSNIKMLAQNVLVVISVSGGSSTGGSCTNALDVTLTSMTGSTLGTYHTSGSSMQVGTSNYTIYQANLSSGWQAKISSNGDKLGSGCLASASIADQTITFNSGSCSQYSFRAGNSSTYEIQLTVNIYAPIGSVTVDESYKTCGATSVGLSLGTSQHPGMTFNWEVSQDNATWVTFRTGAASSITATLTELSPSSFTISKYFTRYVRAVGTNCQSLRKTVKVDIDFMHPAPTLTATATDPKCKGDSTGSLKVTVVSPDPTYVDDFQITIFKQLSNKSYEEQDYIRDGSINGFSKTFTGFGYGTYDIEIIPTHDAVCTVKQFGIKLNDPTEITGHLKASSFNGFNISCSGKKDGTLAVYTASDFKTAGATGGAGSYTYTWTDAVSTTSSASGLSNKEYVVTIKDKNGCTKELKHTLTQPSITVSLVSLGGVGTYGVSCSAVEDGSIAATASSDVAGALTYTWTGPNATALTTSTISNLAAGVYGVTVKDQNACTATSSLTLNARPDVNFNIIELAGIECPGRATGSLSIETSSVTNATSPLTYKWSSNEITSSIASKLAGTYTLTVTDGKGCKATKSKTLTNPPGYTVSVNPLSNFNGSYIKCKGESNGELGTTVKDATGALATASNYTWLKNGGSHASGSGLSSISGLSAGTYKVTITYGPKNCTAEQTYVLVEPGTVTSTIAVTSNHLGYNISCPGASDGSLRVTGGGGTGTSYTYLWNTGVTGPDLSGKKAGTYSVVAKDINLCSSAPASKALVDPPTLVPTIAVKSNYNGLPIKCSGSTDGKLQATSTGGAGTISYTWNTSATGSDLLNVGAGTYIVTARDGNNCTNTASFTITDPTPVTAVITQMSDYNGQAVSCYQASDASLKASGSGGAGTYSYTWSTGFFGNILSGIPAGNYNVIASDANNCFSNPVLHTVADAEPVKVSIKVDSDYNGKPVSCHEASDGVLSASAEGGTGAFAYKWDTGDSGNELIGLPEGKYIVTVHDNNNCIAKDTIYLDAPEPVLASIAEISDYNGFGISCKEGSDGYIEAVGSGGTGGFTFSWLETSERSSRLSNIPEGDYIVEVKDVNGCSDSVRARITSPPQITLDVVSKTDVLCPGGETGSITLAASGGVGEFKYRTSSDDWSSDTTFSGLTAATHLFEVRDKNNCISQVYDTLTEPPPFSVLFDTEPSYCSEPRGSAKAIVSGGTESYSYKWSNSEDDIISAYDLIDSLNVGVYTLTITDANNCQEIASVAISSTDGPVVSLAEIIQPSCSYSVDGSALLSAEGNGPFTFLWVDGQTNARGMNLAKGSYHITVTDTFGCATVKTIEMLAPDPISISLLEKTQPSCNGSCDGKIKVTAQGGMGAYEYDWSGIAGPEISNICAGIYSVKITDGNGCQSAVIPIDLAQPTPLQVALLERQLPSCNGSCDGVLEVSASGANGQYSYSWNEGIPGARFNNICAGDHIVNVIDVKGCAIRKTFQLGQPDAIKASLVKSTRPSCHGTCDGAIEIKAAGGNGGYTYSWVNGTLSHKLTGICADTYSVSITDKKGCELNNQTFAIGQPDNLQVRVISQQLPSCNGDCNGNIKIEALGGTGSYTYTWANGMTDPLLSNLCAGDYSVDVVDDNSCVLDNQVVSLDEPEPIEVQLVRMVPPICYDGCNGSLTVESVGGNGNYSYRWATGVSGAKAEGLCVDEYEVVVTDSKSCTVSSTYAVENGPKVTVDLGGSITVCVGQSHTLSPGTWSKYNWGSNVGLTSTESEINISEAGQYWVDVENSDGCFAQDTFLLQTSTDLLQANLIMSSEATVGDTLVMIDVSWPMPDNISWQYPESMTKVLDLGEIVYGQFFEPGTYEIKLAAQLGDCLDEVVKTITILERTDEEISGRLGYEQFVKRFELYPNPNRGNFDVSVELSEESPITISVWSIVTSLNIGVVRNTGKSDYLMHVDFSPLSAGTYVLRLDHAQGHESIRFIVH